MSIRDISPQANMDLIEIHDYIARNNPRAALRFVEKLDQKIRTLADFPGIGSPYDELARLRTFVVGKHVIFYREIENGIEVVRVLRGARDFKKAFEEGSS